MKLVVGLGNPGLQYEWTRHNAGFMVVTSLAIKAEAHFSPKKSLFCDLAKTSIGSQEVLLVKPTTYMNDSGKAVQALLSWYKLSPDEMLVIHDDVSLPLGKIRLQKAGGAGGQHGIESIMQSLGGAKSFDRLKFGVGPDPGGELRAGYVLSRLPERDRDLCNQVVEVAQEAVKLWVTNGILESMNRFNGLNGHLPGAGQSVD